jgi:hypothetical protein
MLSLQALYSFFLLLAQQNSVICSPSAANSMTNSSETPELISLSHKLQVFVSFPPSPNKTGK